jgi:hypothetical protein
MTPENGKPLLPDSHRDPAYYNRQWGLRPVPMAIGSHLYFHAKSQITGISKAWNYITLGR